MIPLNLHHRFSDLIIWVKRMTLMSVLILLACAELAMAWEPGDPWDTTTYDDAKTFGTDVQTKLGSADAIKERISNPMTSDGSSMRTLDDQTSFVSQMSAPSTNVFLHVLVHPSSTGDITSLHVQQDTDFDGQYDYAYSVPSTVSGICSNGYISASPATWHNPRFYVWDSNTVGEISALQVPSMMSLAGCYCINSSCGSNLVWNNLNVVLRDIGGGMVSAIQEKIPFTITDIHVQGPEIQYYGQASRQIGNTSGIPASGVPDPEQYFHGGTGTLPGEQEAIDQAADPDSFYSRFSVLQNNVGNQYDTQTCSITRQAFLTPQTEIIGYNVSFYVGYDENGTTKECFWATASQECRDVWGSETGWLPCQSLNLSHLGEIVHAITTAGPCIPYTDPVSGQSGCFSPPGTINITSYQFIQKNSSGQTPGCYGSGTDPTHEFWSVRAYVVSDVNTYQQVVQGNLIIGIRDVPQLAQTGSCAGMTGCSKLEEEICDHTNSGCIFSHLNYHSTGLTPISSCYTETSPHTGQLWTFCANGNRITYQSPQNSGVLETGSDVWWNIHRTYTCESNNAFDFSDARQRAEHIQDSLNTGSGTVSYQDLNPLTGATANYASVLPPNDNLSQCESSCQVKIPIQDTQASVSGTTDDYRTTTSSYEVVIRKCENNICPTGQGEILVQNCGCTNYFNAAASTLQVMDEAGKDIICSQQ